MIRVGIRLPVLLLRGHTPGPVSHGCPRRVVPRRNEPGTTGQEPVARGVSRAVPLARVVCTPCRSEDEVLFRKAGTEAGRSSSDSGPWAAGGVEATAPRQALGHLSQEPAASATFDSLPTLEIPAEAMDGAPTTMAVKLAAGAHHPGERRPLPSSPRDDSTLLYVVIGLAGLALAGVLIGLSG